ncbi:MAG: hypothetical protein QM504_15315 [Pseudomonadota bacterium]
MFGFIRKNKRIPPLGVKLSIDLNLNTLDRIAKQSYRPSTEDMTSTWLKGNCVKMSFGIALLNGINQTMLVVGPDNTIYHDLELDIILPFAVGPNKTDTIKICPTDNFIFITLDDYAIMAIPTSYIINALLGEPLVVYDNALEDNVGVKDIQSINIKSATENYELTVETQLAKEWFIYKNTAVKIKSTRLSSYEDFPITLSTNPNER